MKKLTSLKRCFFFYLHKIIGHSPIEWDCLKDGEESGCCKWCGTRVDV